MFEVRDIFHGRGFLVNLWFLVCFQHCYWRHFSIAITGGCWLQRVQWSQGVRPRCNIVVWSCSATTLGRTNVGSRQWFIFGFVFSDAFEELSICCSPCYGKVWGAELGTSILGGNSDKLRVTRMGASLAHSPMKVLKVSMCGRNGSHVRWQTVFGVL
jgi:hypothetical protein